VILTSKIASQMMLVIYNLLLMPHIWHSWQTSTHIMKRLSAQDYVNGILESNRFVLSRAITLVESNRDSDSELAQTVLETLAQNKVKNSIRIGITGSPGVGKSTFIETFGLHLVGLGKKVAVLAIDPSSQRTGGSIMGDKTRMEQLVKQPNAYVRPSASGNTLGGVAKKTREAILLCEYANYDVIIVETVGVGQSEVAVKEMTDFFLLLMLAGAGDELQGIKKGIMEMTDAIAITKADGENIRKAKKAGGEYTGALHLFPSNKSGWYPKVLTCSAIEQTGIAEIWELIESFKIKMTENHFFSQNRSNQNLHWLHETIRQKLLHNFYSDQIVKKALKANETAVKSGEKSAYKVALELLKLAK
jgi:LAO/AO transport system kinase